MTRLVIAVDPGRGASGVAIWQLDGPSFALTASGPLNTSGLLSAFVENIARAGYTQELALNLIDNRIGDAEWAACVERPPPPKLGLRAAPSAAERFWLDVFDLVARRRHERAKLRGETGRFRKPVIVRPRPQEWRGPLGLPIKGIGRTKLEQREFLKAMAIKRIKLVHGVDLGPDAAEAANLAEYAARLVARKLVPARLIGARGRGMTEVLWAA